MRHEMLFNRVRLMSVEMAQDVLGRECPRNTADISGTLRILGDADDLEGWSSGGPRLASHCALMRLPFLLYPG